jgi:Uncharacterized ACR, COG1993
VADRPGHPVSWRSRLRQSRRARSGSVGLGQGRHARPAPNVHRAGPGTPRRRTASPWPAAGRKTRARTMPATAMPWPGPVRSALPSSTRTTRPLTGTNEGQRPCCVSDRIRSGPAVGERGCPLRARDRPGAGVSVPSAAWACRCRCSCGSSSRAAVTAPAVTWLAGGLPHPALSEDLPLVIEIVDTAERVEAFLAAVDDMLTEGPGDHGTGNRTGQFHRGGRGRLQPDESEHVAGQRGGRGAWRCWPSSRSWPPWCRLAGGPGNNPSRSPPSSTAGLDNPWLQDTLGGIRGGVALIP